MKKIFALAMTASILLSACASQTSTETYINIKNNWRDTKMTYHMPAENLPHEGTWLIWPHRYTYGVEYQRELEDIWVQMVEALHTDERVHIIAYSKEEQIRIERLLTDTAVDMKQIDFLIAKSDDVWVRDTGPLFLLDGNNKTVIADFGFDGWGKKVSYKNDDKIPKEVGKQKDIHTIDISSFILEGGAVEVDGNGTLMGALSSVVSKNRNSGLTVKQAEEYLSNYLGIRNFIWLEGVIDEDITDAHIDGMARFLNSQTILTVSQRDFRKLYEHINMDDYTKLKEARNVDGKPYNIVELPLTKKIVEGADCYGSYLNYYIGNKVVLVPIYEDENDEIAIQNIQKLYPNREIVPIVVNNLYQYGGMIHCVTQQQPR